MLSSPKQADLILSCPINFLINVTYVLLAQGAHICNWSHRIIKILDLDKIKIMGVFIIFITICIFKAFASK